MSHFQNTAKIPDSYESKQQTHSYLAGRLYSKDNFQTAKGFFRLAINSSSSFTLTPVLKEELIKHHLCSEKDLRACKTQIRELAYDLPVFDSVWLDALVRLGKLTPWQASTIIEQGTNKLILGEYLLTDLLMDYAGESIFAARKKSGQQQFIVRQHKVLPAEINAKINLLESLSQKISVDQQARIERIIQIVEDESSISIISLHETGLNLKQLLIRRGRLPSTLVTEIARQILLILQDLHSRNIVHGQLILQNVVLSDSGKVILQNVGTGQIFNQSLRELQQKSPEYFDGFAPELADIGNQPNYATDFYSLGCLLWELLAGRPAFIAGDPVTKILRHQRGKFPEIIDIAPDTSEMLADLIAGLTAMHPADRPKSAAEILKKFFSSRLAWGSSLAPLAKDVCQQTKKWTLPAFAPRLNPSLAAFTSIVAVVFLFMYTGDYGKRAQAVLLSRWELLTSSAPPASTYEPKTDNLQPHSINIDQDSLPRSEPFTEGSLPLPDAQGNILLEPGKTYTTRNITSYTPLMIAAPEGQPATLMLSDKTWLVAAPQIIIKNVNCVSSSMPDKSNLNSNQLPSMMNFKTDDLSCFRFIWQGPSTASLETAVFSVFRFPVNPANSLSALPSDHLITPVTGNIQFTQSAFLGAAHTIQTSGEHPNINISNVLKNGRGSLIILTGTSTKQQNIPHKSEIKIEHTTLRDADHLVMTKTDFTSTLSVLKIQAEFNVFDTLSGNDLCRWDIPENPDFQVTREELSRRFAWTGRENLISGQAPFLLGYWSENRAGLKGRFYGIEPGEGFLVTRWKYQGDSARKLEDSQLVNYEGPRFSSALPGFRIHLPIEKDW